MTKQVVVLRYGIRTNSMESIRYIRLFAEENGFGYHSPKKGVHCLIWKFQLKEQNSLTATDSSKDKGVEV